MTDLPGIRVAPVGAWLSAHAPRAQAPFAFTPIAGGKSNLTFRVTDAAGHAWALRRPPLGHLLPTAHDMAREHRIVSALAGTDVPVAPLVGLCEDTSVNDAPFYVMAFVDGVPMRTEADARAAGAAVCARSCESLVDTLVAIHDVDVDAVGLGDLGRKDGYVARQLKRWRRQFEDSKTRELPDIVRVHEILVDRIPEQQGAGIVHGDYRHDNCIFAPDGSVRAVLDWELCTLGDVLNDLAQLLVYWCDPSDEGFTLESPPTVAPGMWDRAHVIEEYARRSTRDLSDIDFYLSFAHWKVACIIEGVYARHAAGAMGADVSADELASLARRVELLAARAAEIAGRL